MSSKERVIKPDIVTTFDDFKSEVFRDLNCIKIGEIQSYDKSTASAQVKIKVKEWIDLDADKSIAYPVIDDVPVFILQGGGAWIEFPIKKGDPCLLLFNDRDIDNWWTSGNETTPHSLRKHSLSDCMAIVGINPKSSALSLTGNLGINGTSHKMDFVNDNQGMADLVGQLFSNIDDILTKISGLISDISSITTTNCVVGAPVAVGPGSIIALTARDTEFTTIKTSVDTLKNDFTQLLGS